MDTAGLGVWDAVGSGVAVGSSSAGLVVLLGCAFSSGMGVGVAITGKTLPEGGGEAVVVVGLEVELSVVDLGVIEGGCVGGVGVGTSGGSMASSEMQENISKNVQQ